MSEVFAHYPALSQTANRISYFSECLPEWYRGNGNRVEAPRGEGVTGPGRSMWQADKGQGWGL